MDKTMEVLEQLASELGVAVEYLWATLVKQHYVEGVTNIVMAVVNIIVIIVLVCILPKVMNFISNKHKELVEDRKKNGTGYFESRFISSETEDFYDFMRKAIPIVGWVSIFILVLFTIGNIKLGIQQILNPDYFALKEVLKTISGTVQ